jgi:hypothetical protein
MTHTLRPNPAKLDVEAAHVYRLDLFFNNAHVYLKGAYTSRKNDERAQESIPNHLTTHATTLRTCVY